MVAAEDDLGASTGLGGEGTAAGSLAAALGPTGLRSGVPIEHQEEFASADGIDALMVPAHAGALVEEVGHGLLVFARRSLQSDDDHLVFPHRPLVARCNARSYECSHSARAGESVRGVW